MPPKVLPPMPVKVATVLLVNAVTQYEVLREMVPKLRAGDPSRAALHAQFRDAERTVLALLASHGASYQSHGYTYVIGGDDELWRLKVPSNSRRINLRPAAEVSRREAS